MKAPLHVFAISDSGRHRIRNPRYINHSITWETNRLFLINLEYFYSSDWR
jgi:hypothetical protein